MSINTPATSTTTAAAAATGAGAAPADRRSGLARTGTVAATVVAASAVNAVIAQIALATGADASFTPLTPGAYVFLTVVGVLLALAGWALVRRVATRPARLLRVLVPVVLLLSFVPDLTTAPNMAGSSTGGVIALVLMHITTAAIAVAGFRRALPVR